MTVMTSESERMVLYMQYAIRYFLLQSFFVLYLLSYLLY